MIPRYNSSVTRLDLKSNSMNNQMMVANRREFKMHTNCYSITSKTEAHHPTIPSHVAKLRNNLPFIVILLFIYLSSVCKAIPSDQENLLCPKSCTCDEQNLEIVCKEYFGASGLPHTLNPNTKRMIINNAQTSQFSGLDYLGKLETIDLSYNKISVVDFRDITKNINLISLNTSHNNITELKDSVLSLALNELGLSISTLQHAFETADLRSLRSSKINVIELILSHNFLTTIRSFTFLRWHKLQRLDLSYNSITALEGQSLHGLSKLEMINLRGNRLIQIPTSALHSSIHSLTYQIQSSLPKPSTLRFIDLSENMFNTIEAESFSLLEKAQELYLESCGIQSIHESAFKGLHTLYLLSLDDNNLNEVPSQSFAYLGLLRLLKLNANKILHVPSEAFTSLVNLEELQLNNGSFSELTNGVFRGLDKLKRLEVAYNPNLTRIDRGTFESALKLNYLSLYGDSLSSLPDNFNEKTHPLTFLDLRGNPLHCGCELKWLTKWLKHFNENVMTIQQSNSNAQSSSFHHSSNEMTQILQMNSFIAADISNLTCSAPPALVGKQIMELPYNKLECLEPTSDLNVHLGFATLFFITTVMVSICLFNLCQNKRHIFVMLKENLAQNHIPMMSPYSQNLHKNVDNLKKETQLYGSDYEHIDYNHHNSQILTVS